MKTIGFLGCGNMGGALARAAIKSIGAENIFVSDVDTKKVKAFADETDVNIADAEYIVLNCDYIFLGVKPQMLKSLFEKIAPVLEERTTDFVLVSMAAVLQSLWGWKDAQHLTLDVVQDETYLFFPNL